MIGNHEVARAIQEAVQLLASILSPLLPRSVHRKGLIESCHSTERCRLIVLDEETIREHKGIYGLVGRSVALDGERSIRLSCNRVTELVSPDRANEVKAFELVGLIVEELKCSQCA